MADIDASTAASSAPATSDAPTNAPRRTWWGLAIVAGALFAFSVAPYVVRSYRFAVGADAPVYVWWARLASHDGLSAVGLRPGLPALVLVLKGTLGLSTVQAVAATGAALAVALGLAAVAVASRRPRGEWVLAGLFAGWYGASLANGYLSALATAVLFLGAVAVLCARRRFGVAAGAGLLGAAAVTHGAFFLVAAVVLAGTAAWLVWKRPRPRLRGALANGTDERRIAGALLGGAGIGVAGLVATAAVGPGAIVGADTSKDAFLRRDGLGGRLPSLYRSRLASNWLRLLLPAEVPLAAYGAGRAEAVERSERLLRTVLLAWLAVTAAGVAVSFATGLLPGERFLSFAFALPVLAAAGVARLWGRGATRADGREPARWARPLAVAALAVIAVGSVWAWWHPAESFREEDMAAAARVAGLVRSLPPGTPLVFVVDDPHHAPLSVPRFGNELRAVVPPDRIRDVHLFVGRPADYLAGRPTITGDPLHNAMSARYLRDLRAALEGTAEPPVAFLLAPMNERNSATAGAKGDANEVLPGVAVVGPAPPLHGTTNPPDPGGPTSPWLIMLFAAAALAVAWLAGAGWSRTALGGGVAAVAAAPAFGIGALLLAGLLVDRLGIRLTGAVPLVLSVLVAGGGFLVARFAGRGGGRDGDRIEPDQVGVPEG